MTERLQRIHTILRAGNVPCALSALPGIGVVLHAGNQDGGLWDVLVHDSNGELRIVDARGAARLPHDLTDAAIGDEIKLHIVQIWADQGNPDAKALISALQSPARHQRSASRWSTAAGDPYGARDVSAQLLDPVQLAGRMFDAAQRLSAIFLTPPASVAVTVWSPWGTVQFGFIRR